MRACVGVMTTAELTLPIVNNRQTYNGKGFPNGVIEHMRDMYTLLRQDATFNNRWIIASPLAVGSVLPAGCCSQWADFGDMHPYPLDGAYLAVTFVPYANISRYFYFSNQPSTNLDQFPEIWNQAKAYYPDRPWFASETGYTTQTGGLGTSLRAHGLYMNRLFAEYFRLGINGSSAPSSTRCSTATTARPTSSPTLAWSTPTTRPSRPTTRSSA
jgi:hypothetical protein